MQSYRPYNVLMMRDSSERRVILSVSGPVNNVQVKSKFENRKEMLPDSLLATLLRRLRDEISQTLTQHYKPPSTLFRLPSPSGP